MKILTPLLLLILPLPAVSADQPDRFAADALLPPALGELLDPDGNGEIDDAGAAQAVANFQKRGSLPNEKLKPAPKVRRERK